MAAVSREGLWSKANPLEPSPAGVAAPKSWTRVGRSPEEPPVWGQTQEASKVFFTYHSACFPPLILLILLACPLLWGACTVLSHLPIPSLFPS